MFTKPDKPTQANKWIHLFQPGDMIIQYGYSKSEIPANKIRQYLIYNKEERCTLSSGQLEQKNYRIYYAYVMYFKEAIDAPFPYNLEDRLRVGDIHTITQWSNTSINTYEGFKVVSSGLSWEDKD